MRAIAPSPTPSEDRQTSAGVLARFVNHNHGSSLLELRISYFDFPRISNFSIVHGPLSIVNNIYLNLTHPPLHRIILPTTFVHTIIVNG